jgi:dsRNA-specific ribonuclease
MIYRVEYNDFIMTVMIGDKVLGNGRSPKCKLAKEEAAKNTVLAIAPQIYHKYYSKNV